MSMVLQRFFLFSISVILAYPVMAAAPGKRIALVIGNSNYKYAPLLVNPTNDAEDVAKTLAGLGFQITKGLDLNKTDMDRALSSFAASLKGAEVGLFFYAGHGLQVFGQNFLMPIDAKLDSSSSLEFEAVRLDAIQRIMENETQTNVLILDACRDNPLTRNLARAMGTRSGAIGKGLAAQESGAGTIISYSTQPGNVALDGSGGRNSPFAGALVKHLPSKGRDLSSILVKVRNDVMAATAKRQVPWEHSALTDELVLARGSTETPPKAVEQNAEPTARKVDENTDSVARPAATKTAESAAAKPEVATQALPASNTLFSDSFDGNALSKHWEVKNEEKDAYLVENGGLLLFTNKQGGVISAPNAMSLTDVNLEGDWDMSLDIRLDMSAYGAQFQLGLVEGIESPVRATINRDKDTGGIGCHHLWLSVDRSGNQVVAHQSIIGATGLCAGPTTPKEEFSRLLVDLKNKGMTLTFAKRGRSYQAKLTSPALKNAIVTEEVFIVVPPGSKPAFALGNGESPDRQTSVVIDEFRIRPAK